MSRFRVTKEDINRRKLLPPGQWYPCEIIKVYDDEATVKGDKVTRTNLDCQVIGGEYVGAVFYVNFNEKFPGFIIPFLEAFGIEADPEAEYEFKKFEGMRLDIFNEHREYQNVYYNSPTKFRPFMGGAVETSA